MAHAPTCADDARGLHVDAATLGGGDGALAVDGIAERVDHAAEQRLADRHVHDGARALDGLAFLNVAIGPEDHDADVVLPRLRAMPRTPDSNSTISPA